MTCFVAAHGCQIDTLEQPVQLLHGELDHLCVLARPDEAFAFESLVQEPEAVAVPAQYLDAVAPAVAKDVDRCGERIALKFVF